MAMAGPRGPANTVPLLRGDALLGSTSTCQPIDTKVTDSVPDGSPAALRPTNTKRSRDWTSEGLNPRQRRQCRGLGLNMGNNSMRRNNQPSRPSRPVSINQHAQSPASSPHRINRVASAPRTTERLAFQSRYRTVKQSRRRYKQATSDRRRRTRPRSRPNPQSGAPIGGDLAVPGDQPTSPLPPEEVQFQTADVSESVQVPAQSLCVPAHSLCVPACDPCQQVAPTRWKVSRKPSEQLQTEECPTADAGISDELAVNSEGSLVTGPSDDVIPPTATGFYFGTNSRQSWPHTVASAEYFTVLSTRRIKQLDPSLFDDELTTTFEDQEEQDCPSDVDDNQAANQASAPACGGAYTRRSSRQRRQRNPSTSRTARLRRTNVPKSSSTKLHVSVMHDVFRRILSVGRRRKLKIKADGEGSRLTALVSPASVKSRSSQRNTHSPSPRSCSLAGRSSSQEDGLPRRPKPVGKENRRTPEPERGKNHYRKYTGAPRKHSKGSAGSRMGGSSQRRIQAKRKSFPVSDQRLMRSYNAEDGTKTLSGSRNISIAGESSCSEKPSGSESQERGKADQEDCACSSGQTSAPQVCASKLESCGPLSLHGSVHGPNSEKANKDDKETRDLHESGTKKRAPVGMSKIIHHTEYLMQCLVKSSIGVQNAVFPHFLAANRSSKTTQINPEDLAQAETLKEDIHSTQKFTALPLREGELHSRRKARKTPGRKNNLNLFTRVRGGAKKDFARTAPFVKSIPASKSANKRSPPLPDNTTKQSVEAARPTTRPRPKLVKKKVPVPSPRVVCATNIPLVRIKPFRVLRMKQTEDGSGSELVSLFRANTRGSSIQSIEVGSSTSVLRLKVAGLLKDTLSSKQRNPGKTSPLQPRPEDTDSQRTAKRDEQRGKTSPLQPQTEETKSQRIAKRDEQRGKGNPLQPQMVDTESQRIAKRDEQRGKASPLQPHMVDTESQRIAKRDEQRGKASRLQPQTEDTESQRIAKRDEDRGKTSPLQPQTEETKSQRIAKRDVQLGKASPLQPQMVDTESQRIAKRDEQKSPKLLGESRRRSCTPVEDHSNKNSPRPSCVPKRVSPSDLTPKSAQKPSSATASLTQTSEPSSKSAEKLSHPTRRKDAGSKPRSSPVFRRQQLRDSEADQRSVQQLNRSGSSKVPTDSPKLSSVSRPTTKTPREIGCSGKTDKVYLSLGCAKSQTNMPSAQPEKLCLPDSPNGPRNGCAVIQVTAMDTEKQLKSSLHQHCSRLVQGSTEDIITRSKSVSTCSCKIHCGYSISATSMIPAVGSYEDKVAPSISRKEFSASVACVEKPPSKPTLEPLEVLKILEDTVNKRPERTPSRNTKDTDSFVNLNASSPRREVPVSQRKSPAKVDRKQVDVQIEVEPDGNFQEQMRSAGVICQSEAAIAPNQPQVPSCIAEYHHERRRLTRAMLDRSNETTSLTGVLLSLQNKNSVQRKGYSAATMAIGGGSPYESSEACGLVSTPSRDVTSLTDAISTISSIPEDTLPKIANSNSSLVDESYFSNILCHCRYCDSFHHEEPPSLKRQIVYEETRDIEPVELRTPKEFCRRYQGRAPAAMHVSWDAMSTLCAHSKCSRCGAHKKQRTDLCQPLFVYDQQDNLCESRRARCGRCIDRCMELPGQGTWYQDQSTSSELCCSRARSFTGDEPSVPNRLTVTSLWPTLLPSPDPSKPDTSVVRIKPRLTLSPVYTTSLPENVEAKSFNKDIVLQRIANLLASRSSIRSMDSNQAIPKEVDNWTGAPESSIRHFGSGPQSLDASCEPRDSHLDRIVTGIADRVQEFLHDMKVAVGELQKK